MIKLTLCLIIVVTISSCYEDSSAGNCMREERFDGVNDCRKINSELPHVDDMTVPGKYFPTFKGNGSADLVYIKVSDNSQHLIRFNANSGQHNVLLEGKNLGKPYYGASGWVSLIGNSRGTGCLFIHETGDSTFEWVVNGYFEQGLEWNADGTKFYTRYTDNEVSDRKYNLVVDFPDLDTQVMTYSGLSGGIQPPIWSVSNPNLLYVINNKVLYEFNITKDLQKPSEKLLTLKDYNYTWARLGWDFKIDKQRMFGYEIPAFGICRINLESGEEVRLRKNCESRIYYDFDIIPNNDGLLVACQKAQFAGDGRTVDFTRDFYFMGLDGCDERPYFD
ncbi:MAG: hypothetical protein KDC92_05310 [Bacteroidetes bacterium]|nr:hypothetical protein [Bacteroidota bacterium]